MTNLHDILWNSTVDELRVRLGFLMPTSRVTRKADFIDTIKAALEGSALTQAWSALDETEKLAVAEAVYQPGHTHQPERFESKYGREAEFHRKPPEKPSYSSWESPKNATRLNIFFYPDRDSGGRVIPHDLAARLRPLVAEPRAASVPRITVLNNRSIHVTSGSLAPAERLQIETWAEPSGETVFRVDELRALDAVQAGHDPAQFAFFLRERDDQPLPETMEAFLKQARDNGEAVRQCATAVIFECKDTRTAELLATRKELAKLCLRAGETTLAVREEGLPTFRKQVRALGFGIR